MHKSSTGILSGTVLDANHEIFFIIKSGIGICKQTTKVSQRVKKSFLLCFYYKIIFRNILINEDCWMFPLFFFNCLRKKKFPIRITLNLSLRTFSMNFSLSNFLLLCSSINCSKKSKGNVQIQESTILLAPILHLQMLYPASLWLL